MALQQRGLRAVVADGMRPPIDKACGEGLMPASVSALEALGVHIPPERARRFVGVGFNENGRRGEGDFSNGYGLAIRRTVLHAEMVERAEQCGVAFRWGAPVTELRLDGITAGTEHLRARWIVGADGSRSLVRGWAHLEHSSRYHPRYAFRRHYRIAPWSARMEVYWGPLGQAYVTPLGPEEVCVAVLSRHPRLRLDAALLAFPELRAKIADALPISVERGAVTSMHSLRRVWRDNVALVGDASGGVDAITGEGLGLSFRQADALATAIHHGDLRIYQQQHRRLAKVPSLTSRLLLLMDSHPSLRRRALRALTDRNLFHRLLAVYTGPASARDLLGAGMRLGLKLLESGA